MKARLLVQCSLTCKKPLTWFSSLYFYQSFRSMASRLLSLLGLTAVYQTVISLFIVLFLNLNLDFSNLVSEGSFIGPSLFLIHVNDLTKSIKNCNIQIYATCPVIFFSDKNIVTIKKILTAELTNISNCLDDNRLVISLLEEN